ncbi:TetR/AcrR family transcriptional regulator [Streptoalloteichus hindustanus]|uniref:Transcriptional regulator, TetR family n=1 Tax=Streptoalloteichus hindustanus TaxID=2017 RepID=A0A1M4UPK3_STRHI|nr:TetR family transcriptional regulator [Streptoalloteichus hindustanus]SHE58619.1 transcriptional regulator, TetR family [Streptoalloteichus hindustanus]
MTGVGAGNEQGRVDGRRAKGERRRREIIDATLRVIEREGVGGVTHRVVAREAEVPTTATTYYFAGLHDLLVAALTTAAEDYAAQIHELAAATPLTEENDVDVLAGLLTEAAGQRRGRTIAEYELHLLAARHPALRPAARRWVEVMTEICRPLLPSEIAFRALVAAVDGLMVQALVADEPPTAEDFRPVLEYLIRPK